MRIVGFDPTAVFEEARTALLEISDDASPAEYVAAVNRAVRILRGDARRPSWDNRDSLESILREYRDRRGDLETFWTSRTGSGCSGVEVFGARFPNGETVETHVRLNSYDAILSIRARVA